MCNMPCYNVPCVFQGSIEEKVYQRQISKQGLSGAVMDLRERNDVQFSREDLKVQRCKVSLGSSINQVINTQMPKIMISTSTRALLERVVCCLTLRSDCSQDLFTLSERTACDTHTLLDCQCGGKGVLPSDTVTHASETSRPCQLGAPAVKSHSKVRLSEWEMYWVNSGVCQQCDSYIKSWNYWIRVPAVISSSQSSNECSEVYRNTTCYKFNVAWRHVRLP